MNVAYLSFRSIVSRPLSSFLSWLLLAFGVTVVVLILLISDQLKREISKNAQGIDLVVGAKGSPLQLILSNIFHIDFPTGNIDLKDAAEVSRSRYIEYSIPISLGDSYTGYRIVGTTRAYADLYKGMLQDGRWFEEEMQAVIGHEVAERLGLRIGDTFESQHGLDESGEGHGAHPFVVVGILAENETVINRMILTPLQSIWEVHGHEQDHEHGEDSVITVQHLGISVTSEQYTGEQITALLIKYRSPMGAVMLPRTINERANLQSASPAYETARLFNIIGVGVSVLQWLGLLIIVISGISVFVALLNSLKDRKYEIAIMRSMGATRQKIFIYILLEGLFTTLLGTLSGLVIAHLMVGFLGQKISGLNPEILYFVPAEGMVLAGSLIIGTLAALIPSIMAYRVDISKTLAKG